MNNEYGFDDIAYMISLLWQLPGQITDCLGAWRMTEKLVRKMLVITDIPEVTKNIAVNLIFRGGSLATNIWEMTLGFFGNDPYRLGAGLGNYLDELLF